MSLGRPSQSRGRRCRSLRHPSPTRMGTALPRTSETPPARAPARCARSSMSSRPPSLGRNRAPTCRTPGSGRGRCCIACCCHSRTRPPSFARPYQDLHRQGQRAGDGRQSNERQRLAARATLKARRHGMQGTLRSGRTKVVTAFTQSDARRKKEGQERRAKPAEVVGAGRDRMAGAALRAGIARAQLPVSRAVVTVAIRRRWRLRIGIRGVITGARRERILTQVWRRQHPTASGHAVCAAPRAAARATLA